MPEKLESLSSFSAQPKTIPHFSTKDFKWSGIPHCWACNGIPEVYFSKISSSSVWKKKFRLVSKGSFNKWSSFSSNLVKWSSSSLLTLNGESNSVAGFFIDEGIEDKLGETLKNFIFEFGKEMTEYLKCRWNLFWITDLFEVEGAWRWAQFVISGFWSGINLAFVNLFLQASFNLFLLTKCFGNGLKRVRKSFDFECSLAFALFPDLVEEKKEEEENKSADGLKLGTLLKGISRGKVAFPCWIVFTAGSKQMAWEGDPDLFESRLAFGFSMNKRGGCRIFLFWPWLCWSWICWPWLCWPWSNCCSSKVLVR